MGNERQRHGNKTGTEWNCPFCCTDGKWELFLTPTVSQLIPAMPSMEQFVTARKVALENSVLVGRLESHAPQDATQGDLM